MPIHADILTPLADALAELYPDQASARAMATTAGLTLGQIPFDARASNTWVFLLNEAEAQGRTPAVLARAREQYPVQEGLDSACQAYAGWAAAGRAQEGGLYGATQKPYRLNVPTPPSHFTGRADLVQQLAGRLCSSRSPTLALHGLPGVGKSTLAAVLAGHPAVQAHFADGVLWAGLGPQAYFMSTLAA